jgi:hypothetical protein
MWLNGLRSTEKPGALSFKDWIKMGDGFAVTSLPTNSSIEIQVHQEQDFLRPAAFEINIWASSAFETITSIANNPIRSNAIAWPLIQLYYSSFFSAHSILRAFGFICSRLESVHITTLRKYAHAIGLPASISDGFYVFEYDRSLSRIYAQNVKDSHADTWKTFFKLLNILSTEVLNIKATSTTKIAASDCFTGLCDILKNGGSATGGNWLSMFRNRVNYQKSNGAWYPYDKSNPTTKDLLHSIARWKSQDPEFLLRHSNNEIKNFVEASVFIVYLCRIMITELSQTRLLNEHFVDRGGIDYLYFSKVEKSKSA